MRTAFLILLLAGLPSSFAYGVNDEWQGDIGSRKLQTLSIDVEFPRIADIFGPVEPGGAPRHLSLWIRPPVNAPSDVKAIAYLKSKDGMWYQTLTKGPFRPGEWEKVTFVLQPGGGGVLPDKHFFAYNGYTSTRMETVGLKMFSPSVYRGSIELRNISVGTGPLAEPPLRIVGIRKNAGMTEVMDRFEVTFGLSRSFVNPFDNDKVKVSGTFVSPSGKVAVVPGFVYRDFVRSKGEDEEILTPHGRQEWKVRFTPVEPGKYTFFLSCRAGRDEVKSERSEFEVVPSAEKGFVRVSREDPNWFEFSTGQQFYPIGHNVRSPTDPRCASMVYDIEEPVDMGTYAYDDYFAKMSAGGENVAEVWMASWWVGLEWTKRWKTYYGVGHYSMENAWKLDYLLDLCEKYDMYLHLVIDNHGKTSIWCDDEWKDNPHSVKNGGYLKTPEDYFKEEKARDLHKKKLWYIVGRWAHSPRIMGFEMWSELNLVGTSGSSFNKHPAKREWHREMIRYLHQIDSYDHLFTTHYSGDYGVVDTMMAKMPEIDYLAVDAYRGGGGTIIPLMRRTAQFAREYGKPLFVTEYGGNWNAFQGDPDRLQRLEADLHTGTWSAFMSGIPATPLLWWFDFIEREDLYYHFSGFANFTDGENLRGRGLENKEAEVEGDEEVEAVALIGEGRSYMWICDERVAIKADSEDKARSVQNVKVSVEMPSGSYSVEYWDTYRGTVIDTVLASSEENTLVLNVPSFKRDIACKISPAQ